MTSAKPERYLSDEWKKYMEGPLTQADYLLLSLLDYDWPPYLSPMQSSRAEKLVRRGLAERKSTASPRYVRRTALGDEVLRMHRSGDIKKLT